MNILNVKIDSLLRKEIFSKLNAFLNEDRFHQIATVNPEFVLAAQKDEEFRYILNQCDLNVADGVGIWFAFLRFGKYLKARIAGIDLLLEILKIADEKKLGVFLIASDRGLSSFEDTSKVILKKYPKIKIGGMNIAKISNFQFPISKQIPNSNDKFQNIANYDIIFCNFGVPEQEKFLHSLKLLKDSKIRLAVGVGGSFDYLTGKVRRAPVLLRKAGLEWLWRLILEPRYRFKRIWKAVIVFPLKIILSQNNE